MIFLTLEKPKSSPAYFNDKTKKNECCCLFVRECQWRLGHGRRGFGVAARDAAVAQGSQAGGLLKTIPQLDSVHLSVLSKKKISCTVVFSS